MAHHTFIDYMGTPISGWIVPQQQYSSGSGRFQPRPSIKFSDDGRWGMKLKRALDMDFRGMPDSAAQAVLSETGTKVAIRILWPGYLPWTQHMHAFDHTNARQPITKSRLAYDIARLVKLFYDDMQHAQSSEASADWWVSRMRFEDLILLELRNVSAGSWQPVLCLAPR
ncbi:hypothetical protein BDY19DRAFT_226246 [Irpex rosettiformis]|uniref:Uncharacterized protein n=1 Tax=Irpex rosettiformis TaxID=378272 RepID=A0ACB8U0K4_9APHY|nr:hypothetical protein BDY19DRAFT_226246 [Irpex rosettiformis]